MAKTIAQLTDATTVNDADELIIQQGSITKRATAGELFTVTSTSTTTGRSLKDRFAERINVKDFGAVGDGTTPDTEAINFAIAAGSNVFFPPGTYLVQAALTSLGAGKVATFAPGAILTAASTQTWAFNNNARIDAPRRQIFAGAMTVSNLVESRPEWWGASNSTTVTCNAAMQAALDALRPNGVMRLAMGFYAIDGTTAIAISKGQNVVGEGKNNTNIVITTAATNCFHVTVTRGSGIRGLKIYGASTITPTSGHAIFYEQTSTTVTSGYFTISDIQIERIFNAMTFKGNSTQTLGSGTIRDVIIWSVYGYVCLTNWCENFIFSNMNINCATDGGATGAPNGGIVLLNKCQSVDFTDVMLANAAGGGLVLSNDSGTTAYSPADAPRWCKFVGCTFDDCSTAIDLNNCVDIRFVSCWATSSGRSIRGYAGDGVRIRGNTEGIYFIGGVFCNNGQRGFRIDGDEPGDPPAVANRSIVIMGASICGNSLNNSTTPFYAIDVYGGVSGFIIKDNVIGGTGASKWPSLVQNGIQVRAGASNNYIIANNIVFGTPSSVSGQIVDSGTGTNKVVSGNLVY